jgi:hypothetical protein
VVYAFPDWVEEIAEVSGDPEFLTATIQLLDPSLWTTPPDYDIDTDTWTPGVGSPLVIETRARIIALRSWNALSGDSTGNPDGIKNIQVSFPYEAFPQRVSKDWQVRIVDGGRFPGLESYLYTVKADQFSSLMASHHLDCVVALESAIAGVPYDQTGFGGFGLSPFG